MNTLRIVFKDGSFESYYFVSFVRCGHKFLYFHDRGIQREFLISEISYFNVF